MSEEAPLEQPVDESQLVQNPEKAHAMALAGDEHRSEAMLDRVQAEKLVGDHELGSMREHYVNDSIENDKVAKELEEQAGQQYDADHPLATEGVATETGAASETSDASKEISEFISLYTQLQDYDQNSPYLGYLRESIMHNEEHLIQDPEKAKELYKQLSYSEESSLRMQAAFQFKVMLKIDKLLAIDTMQHIIRDANDGDLETISGILDSFLDDDDKLDESLAHADVMQLLKTYVGRLSEKQTV